MRRTMILIAVVIALLAVSIPALGHSVGYTFRESGSTSDCGPGTDVTTRIYAKAHAKHEKTGVGSAFFHVPDDGNWYVTYFDWNVVAMNWRLSNQSFRAYSYSGSFGYCSSA